MNRKVELKIILKTVIYCLAAFLIIGAGIYYYVTNNFQSRYNNEFLLQIVVSKTDIPLNTIITEDMLDYRIVNQSIATDNMINKIDEIVGQKNTSKIRKGDILRRAEILDKSVWYSNYERVIVMPMDIEQRLGNLVKKNSFVDIKLRQQGALPQVILSKILVDEIIDENGIPAGNDVGGKKTFAKFILNEEQRNRLYASMDFGKPIIELYCNDVQSRVEETFAIPLEYYTNPLNPIFPKINSNTAPKSTH